MKNITRERKILENRRLDLDACKGRVRKARAMQLQPPVILSDHSILYSKPLKKIYFLPLTRKKALIRELCSIRFDTILIPIEHSHDEHNSLKQIV